MSFIPTCRNSLDSYDPDLGIVGNAGEILYKIQRFIVQNQCILQ